MKVHLKSVCMIIIILLNVDTILGQTGTQKILPGNKEVNGKHLKPYTNKWKVTLITPKGDKRFFQVWTDYLQKIELNGKTYIHRIQDIYDTKENLLKTQMNFVNEENLVPVRASIVGTDGSYNFFEFSDSHVMGNYTSQVDKEKVLKFDKTFNCGVLDWSLYGILLAGLPLKVGFHATLPIYEFPNPEDGWLTVDVNEMEQVKTIGGETISTFKVETNQDMVFSISKNAPYVIKLVYKTPKGATLIWDMM